MPDETKEFDLEAYLASGIENIVKTLIKTSDFFSAQRRFLLRYAAACKKAGALRRKAAAQGEHIPPFLIASITSVCNLHCAGCYARSLETCVDGEPVRQMTADAWGRVFSEARELGISFILLAGGEPMARRDVIKKAAEYPQILFPIFTNGTMFTDEYTDLFDKHRNLVPIFSIEGGTDKTDERRGAWVYGKVQAAMRTMDKRGIAFGASVTVTKENLDEVTSEAWIGGLAESGCKAVIYVEFVPTEDGAKELALGEIEREALAERVSRLRKSGSVLVISFPGDEKASGGCLAAGRGFFHINSHGGAEPCPFSPYSDMNVTEHPLKEMIHSELFSKIINLELLQKEHDGGCVLYQNRDKVEELLPTEKRI